MSHQNMPSHANAQHSGNGREGYQRPAMKHAVPQHIRRKMEHEAVCNFPLPAASRLYCMPAPWTSSCGQKYHNLVSAYGQSRPSTGGL